MNQKEGDERAQRANQHDGSGIYEVRVKGHLGAQWSAWFDGMTLIQHADSTTSIQGPIADQAALHGVLQKVRDLGIELISVVRIPG
jgi:hypothetical protein